MIFYAMNCPNHPSPLAAAEIALAISIFVKAITARTLLLFNNHSLKSLTLADMESNLKIS
jgi:hypothetical protein